MSPEPQPELEEINLQERTVEMPADNSLPASQVIKDQNDDAEQNNAPSFIP